MRPIVVRLRYIHAGESQTTTHYLELLVWICKNLTGMISVVYKTQIIALIWLELNCWSACSHADSHIPECLLLLWLHWTERWHHSAPSDPDLKRWIETVYVFELRLVSLENGTSGPNCGLGESEYFHIVVYCKTLFPSKFYIDVYVSVDLYSYSYT